jgi:serine/threonine-protein kinase
LVVDHTSGLTWRQSGSQRGLRYTEAELYVRDLNNHWFAGYNDWHLPTLEEAMSLIEPKRKNGVLHINAVFDCTQVGIWTADKESASSAWVVYFYDGDCVRDRVVGYYSYVRAVRL